MNLSDRLQVILQQYEGMERSVRILQSSAENSLQTAREIKEAVGV